MQQKPPVPKFCDQCLTPKRSMDMIEEISHLIFKWNLDSEIEKKAISILNVLTLPQTTLHAQALVHYSMKLLKYPPIKQEHKVEYLSKCIEVQHQSLITTLCQKLKMDSKSTHVCEVLLKQMQPLINKLPKSLQNAIAVKIATDIIYLKQGGIGLKIIANFANLKPEQLNSSLNRIKPFAFKVIQDLFNYFNNHSI